MSVKKTPKTPSAPGLVSLTLPHNPRFSSSPFGLYQHNTSSFTHNLLITQSGSLSTHYITIAIANPVIACFSNKFLSLRRSLSLSRCLVLADGNFLVCAKALSNEALLVAVAVFRALLSAAWLSEGQLWHAPRTSLILHCVRTKNNGLTGTGRSPPLSHFHSHSLVCVRALLFLRPFN